jgi:hypothetical protein
MYNQPYMHMHLYCAITVDDLLLILIMKGICSNVLLLGPIDNYKDILETARRICASTSAPPYWTPLHPLFLHRPPAPQEDRMRNSLLFRSQCPLNDDDVGGDVEAVVYGHGKSIL